MELSNNVYLNLATELARVMFLVIFCHFTGDYLFQTNYMAKKKNTDWWVMMAHCFCYTLPFLLCFGLRWQTVFVLVTHYFIDCGKCNGWYGIFFDQYFHILAGATYIFPVLSEGSWRAVSL